MHRLAIWIVLSGGMTAGAVSFSGGTGEPNDPYKIATAEQLVSIGSDPNLLTRHFVLVADIDLSPSRPGGMVFNKAVIASSSKTPFSGSFDGAGYVIRNLTLDYADDAGLFGTVAKTGIVKNLGLENVAITGLANVAALAGTNNGTISSCHSSGSVDGLWSTVGGLAGTNHGTIVSSYSAGAVTGEEWTGGLVATSDGTVILCYSTADVTGWGLIGGLIGDNKGVVASSYSTGTVTGDEFQVGGLLGINEGMATSCYATGDVTASDTVGGLAGENSLFGTLIDCYASGIVTSTHQAIGSCGGLVGRNSGTVTSCHATGSVSGAQSVGGLLGSNDSFGDVSGCYASGSVTSSSWESMFTGGLAGDNSGTIASCWAMGSVSGSEYVGGLVGYSGGTVATCYSTGAVSGWGDVGGLVGHAGGTIKTCYSTGRVSGSSYYGGLVGWGSGSIESSYFLAPSSGGGRDNGFGTALTAAQMKQQGSFVGFDFWADPTDGSDDDWFMPASQPPVLLWQTEKTGLRTIPDIRGRTLEEAVSMLAAAGLIVAAETQSDYDRTVPAGLALRTYPSAYASTGSTVAIILSLGPYDWSINPGDGTSATPYQISNVTELESLMDHPELWGRSFVLTADIDLSGRTYSRAAIAMDTTDDQDGFQGTTFTGSFDGNGFKILNLSISTQINDYLGLFGFIAQGALVRNVDLVNAQIKGKGGSYYVGTVAGYNAGTISDCYIKGIVSGRSGLVGTIVGGNSGVVQNCTALVSRMGWGG